MQAGLPHRTGRHPLIIHLAPKASTDKLSIRSATQNRTKAARRQSTQCQCPCIVPLRPSREHVHNMASARSSHHGSMSNDTSMLATRFAGAPRRVATCRRGRFARARPRTPSPMSPGGFRECTRCQVQSTQSARTGGAAAAHFTTTNTRQTRPSARTTLVSENADSSSAACT